MFLSLTIGKTIQVGITDIETEGIWKTFHGELAPYLNWNKENPSGGSEPSGGRSSNYAIMYAETGNPKLPAGTWNDVRGLNTRMLCSYEPSVHSQLKATWLREGVSHDLAMFFAFETSSFQIYF